MEYFFFFKKKDIEDLTRHPRSNQGLKIFHEVRCTNSGRGAVTPFDRVASASVPQRIFR